MVEDSKLFGHKGKPFLEVGQIISVRLFSSLLSMLDYINSLLSTIPLNLTLAMVDIYCVLLEQPVQKPQIVLPISIGDWAVFVVSLASASSAASVVGILRSDEISCPPTICNRYQFAATLAFLIWFLSLSSSLFNLWLLPSLI